MNKHGGANIGVVDADYLFHAGSTTGPHRLTEYFRLDFFFWKYTAVLFGVFLQRSFNNTHPFPYRGGRGGRLGAEVAAVRTEARLSQALPLLETLRRQGVSAGAPITVQAPCQRQCPLSPLMPPMAVNAEVSF